MEQSSKTVSVSFRVSPQFKRCLEQAAALERRSQTNMLEKLLFDYCRIHGVASMSDSTAKSANKRSK